MEEHNRMQERLWDYADGRVGKDEQAAIENLLSTDPVWKAAWQEVTSIHQAMQAEDLEMPSMRFTRNVMEEVAKHKIAPATGSYVNKNIVYIIGGFFILLIMGFLVYLFSQIDFGKSSTDWTPIDLSALTKGWQQLVDPGYLNLFLMLDVVLGLYYLDIFLRRKSKSTAKPSF